MDFDFEAIPVPFRMQPGLRRLAAGTPQLTSLRPGSPLWMEKSRVLQAGLPSALRDRMPFERTLLVVRQVHGTPDLWAAVVEGSAELLGWTHYAKIHAATVIRAAIEHDYRARHVR